MSLPQPTAGGAPSLRRGVLAASLVLVVASLSSCAAGNDAQTLRISPDNAAATVGDIEVQNAVVIVATGEDAPVSVSATLFNNGDAAQTLESVTIEGGGGPLKLSAAGGKGATIRVPAGGSVLLGGKGNASASLQGASGAQAPSLGGFDKVTFGFSETGEVSLEANVVSAEGYYEPFGPTAEPTRTAAPEASGSPSASASPAEGASGNAQSAGEDEAPADASVGASQSPGASPSDNAGH